MSRSVIALLVGVLSLAAYLTTLAPGLTYTDAGELATACATLGVAHPTGYPLFTLLGHVWTWLPFPSVIYGMNVFAAVCVSAAAGMLVGSSTGSSTGSSMGSSKWVGGATSLCFAFAVPCWSQATSVEVYSLQTLLFVSTLFAIHRMFAQPQAAQRWALLTCLLTGLMLTNHLTSAFLIPGIAVAVWAALFKREASASTKRESAATSDLTPSPTMLVAMLVLAVLIPVSLYLYLPLRSAQSPLTNWGEVHRSWDAFLYHVSGSQFQVWITDDAVKENWPRFWKQVPSMLVWVGFIPMIVGLIASFGRRVQWLGFALLLMWIGNTFIAMRYGIHDIDSYFLPSYAIMFIWMARGLTWMLDRVKAAPALQYAPLALPIIAFAVNVSHQDRSKEREVELYTQYVFDNLEPNAVVLSQQWDYFVSAAWYKQRVEGVRTDVAVIDKELLRRTWYPVSLLREQPNVVGPVRPEIDAYMPLLTFFENDSKEFMKSSASVAQIQERFVALLNALLDKNSDRPLYITPELLQGEEGFGAGYRAYQVGPVLRLTRDTTFVPPAPNTRVLGDLQASLVGRKGHLVKGMRELIGR